MQIRLIPHLKKSKLCHCVIPHSAEINFFRYLIFDKGRASKNHDLFLEEMSPIRGEGSTTIRLKKLTFFRQINKNIPHVLKTFFFYVKTLILYFQLSPLVWVQVQIKFYQKNTIFVLLFFSSYKDWGRRVRA